MASCRQHYQVKRRSSVWPLDAWEQNPEMEIGQHVLWFGLVCWSLTSLCHSNGHIETMPAREINPFTALTRIRSQFLRTQ